MVDGTRPAIYFSSHSYKNFFYKLKVDCYTIMSQTSNFVKNLASSDEESRDKALESLTEFLKATAEKQSLLELEKLWKGLYFAMWYCDGGENQERLSENLGQLFNGGVSRKAWPKFLKAFYTIIIRQWYDIDQWRLDKYYLLIRRVVRNSFRYLKANHWDKKLVNSYNDLMRELPLSGKNTISFAIPYHLCDIYLDELELILGDDIDDAPIEMIIEPFKIISKEAQLKTLRQKCKEDVLDDARLKVWLGEEEEEQSDNNNEEDDEEDEWKGFGN